jgi:hypothetical protein
MPQVTLLCPRGMIWQQDVKMSIMTALKEIVARHLSDTRMPQYKELALKPDDVDVMISTYERQDAMLSTPFSVQIQGYDDPNRMETITARIRAIAEDVARCLKDTSDAGLGTLLDMAGNGHLVSVTFVPLPRGCWTSSS